MTWCSGQMNPEQLVSNIKRSSLLFLLRGGGHVALPYRSPYRANYTTHPMLNSDKHHFQVLTIWLLTKGKWLTGNINILEERFYMKTANRNLLPILRIVAVCNYNFQIHTYVFIAMQLFQCAHLFVVGCPLF